MLDNFKELVDTIMKVDVDISFWSIKVIQLFSF